MSTDEEVFLFVATILFWLYVFVLLIAIDTARDQFVDANKKVEQP